MSAAAAGLALTGAAASTAPPLPGAEVPAFVAALNDWLADDEAAALPALADLAGAGNGAARVLLGQIDKMPSLQGPYLAHMPRARRIALLRAPGGLSGRSWLGEQAGTPLADAWMALRSPGSGPELVERFQTLGEPRAAREAFITLAAREQPGLAAIDPAAVDSDLLYLLWRLGDADERTRIAALVPPGHAQWQMMGQVLDARSLERWLLTSQAAEPLTALCRSVCPESLGTCLGAAYGALGSHDALLTLGTPAETLVSQAEFLASPRGQASVMRRILLASSMRARRAMIERVTGAVACLGEALTTESIRYRPALPGVVDGG